MKLFPGEDIAMFYTDGHAGSHLVRPKVGMTYREERYKDAFKNAALYQPRQEAKHVCILIFPDAVVHLEVQVGGQPAPEVLHVDDRAVKYLNCHTRIVEMIFQTVIHETLLQIPASRDGNDQMGLQTHCPVLLRTLRELWQAPL